MTGPYDSVIGIEKSLALKKFLTGMPVRFSVARRDPRLCGVVIEVDDATGRARRIERIQVRPDAADEADRDDAQPV
jgi:calcineurin-like phosphoesterase